VVIQHYKNYPETIPIFNREHNLHKFGYAVARTDTILLSIIGIVLGVFGKNNKGLLLNGIVLIVAIIRLFIGGGLF